MIDRSSARRREAASRGTSQPVRPHTAAVPQPARLLARRRSWRRREVRAVWLCGLLLALTVGGPSRPAAAKDPQLVPNRLASVGDSITEAINAEEFNPFEIENPNHWASFVNGSHGFWDMVFGRTDVHSHNQRITELFGSEGRENFINGLSGADSFDLADQAAMTVAQQATYTTLLMGHNDVCQDDFADIPSDAEFEANVRSALDQYQAGLPNGATVYVMGIVDIYKLWQLGDELEALGLLPCEVIWATTLLELFPCGTMLSPLNSEADRQFTRGRNIAFNQILESLTAEYQANDPHHHYVFSNGIFEADFTPEQVSDFDCFHPSALGQKDLAQGTWEQGPFALPEPSGGLVWGLSLLLALRRRHGARRPARSR